MTQASFDQYFEWLKIPKHQRPPTAYQLLGIEPKEFDESLLDQAVREREGIVRKQRSGPHKVEADSLLIELQEARLTLGNAGAREKYDAKLDRILKAQAAKAASDLLAAKHKKSVGEDGGVIVLAFKIAAGLALVLGLLAATIYGHRWLSNGPEIIPVAQRPAVRDTTSPTPTPTPAPVATDPDGRPLELVNTISMPLRLIGPGEYLMGAPFNEIPRDPGDNFEAQHPVRITKPFYLGKFEVTRGEFRKFIQETKYVTEAEVAREKAVADRKAGLRKDLPPEKFQTEFSDDATWLTPLFDQTDAHPVVLVTRKDAIKFCEWLSQKEGKKYRLPTEAEWELACRCGSTGRWSFGEDESLAPRYENLGDVSIGKIIPQFAPKLSAPNDGFAFTAPVGSFLPNKLGLHDMYGNVEEWCADQGATKYDPKVVADDPLGKDGKSYLSRGGSWIIGANIARNALRTRQASFMRNYTLGFRVACDAPPPPPRNVSLGTGPTKSP